MLVSRVRGKTIINGILPCVMTFKTLSSHALQPLRSVSLRSRLPAFPVEVTRWKVFCQDSGSQQNICHR